MQLARDPTPLLLVYRHEACGEGRKLLLPLRQVRPEAVDHPSARRGRHHAGDERADREPEGRRRQGARGEDRADQREAHAHHRPDEDRASRTPRVECRAPHEEAGQQVGHDRRIGGCGVRLEVQVEEQVGREPEDEEQAQLLGIPRAEGGVGGEQHGAPDSGCKEIERQDLEQRRRPQVVHQERHEQQSRERQQGGEPELRPRREIGAVAFVRHVGRLYGPPGTDASTVLFPKSRDAVAPRHRWCYPEAAVG